MLTPTVARYPRKMPRRRCSCGKALFGRRTGLHETASTSIPDPTESLVMPEMQRGWSLDPARIRDALRDPVMRRLSAAGRAFGPEIPDAAERLAFQMACWNMWAECHPAVEVFALLDRLSEGRRPDSVLVRHAWAIHRKAAAAKVYRLGRRSLPQPDGSIFSQPDRAFDSPWAEVRTMLHRLESGDGEVEAWQMASHAARGRIAGSRGGLEMVVGPPPGLIERVRASLEERPGGGRGHPGDVGLDELILEIAAAYVAVVGSPRRFWYERKDAPTRAAGAGLDLTARIGALYDLVQRVPTTGLLAPHRFRRLMPIIKRLAAS